MIHYNQNHKWYYWSNMQPDEVIAIKVRLGPADVRPTTLAYDRVASPPQCYDNKATDGSAPHTGYAS
jgi:hypothetical protein